MKHEFDVKAWQALVKKSSAKKEFEDPDVVDPVAQVVLAFLAWRSTESEAEDALGRIMEVMIDYNDLRVSDEAQIAGLVGKSYPFVQERVARMVEVLNELFKREHAVSMASVASSSKKDQKHYLETLPGIVPYVASRVQLICFGGHAFPVDERILTLMVKGGVVDAEITPAEAEALLLRQVKAADTLKTYQAIQAASDRQKWADKGVEPHAPKRALELAETALTEASKREKEAATVKAASKSKSSKAKTSKASKTAKVSKTSKKKTTSKKAKA
ncbi:hypothetical protein [Mucisphaera sp.]|uniref:hypothetical protein n=1 Tax=Mucisphaera sp. TaxID=2913024 RepID=UPI003D13FC29